MSEGPCAGGLVACEGTGWLPGAGRRDEGAAPTTPVRALATGGKVSAAECFQSSVSRFGEAFAKHETLVGWQRAIGSLGRECQDQYGTLALLGEARKSSRGRLGALWRRNCVSSNSPSSGASPKFSRELLPLSLPAARAYLADVHPLPVGEEGPCSLRIEASRYWALTVVGLLGFHATAGWTSKEVGGARDSTVEFYGSIIEPKKNSTQHCGILWFNCLTKKSESLTVEEMFVKGNTRKTNIYSTAPIFMFLLIICDNWIFIVFSNIKFNQPIKQQI